MLRNCVHPWHKKVHCLVLSQRLESISKSLQRIGVLRFQVLHLKFYCSTTSTKISCSNSATISAFMKKGVPNSIAGHLIMISIKAQPSLFTTSFSIFSLVANLIFLHQMLRSKTAGTPCFLSQLSQNCLIQIKTATSLS